MLKLEISTVSFNSISLEIGSFSYDFQDDRSAAMEELEAPFSLSATTYLDSTPVQSVLESVVVATTVMKTDLRLSRGW